MFKGSEENGEEKLSSEMKCTRVTEAEAFDEFFRVSVCQTQADEKLYHGTFKEIVLNIQENQKIHMF